jgi:hypothetical protein
MGGVNISEDKLLPSMEAAPKELRFPRISTCSWTNDGKAVVGTSSCAILKTRHRKKRVVFLRKIDARPRGLARKG